MADIKKRLPGNVPGEFFVDSTCIDCDTCRQLAPETFEDSGDYSVVYAQPETEAARRKAIRALLACPTGSIGTLHEIHTREVREDFPLPLEDGVYYTGFNSPKSYGGNSYFVQHSQGNWLIDSPKYLPHLIKKFEALGGIKYIFLTHRDDVAEADRYAKKFNSRRIIHRADLSAQPDAEIIIEGYEAIEFSPEFWIIPTPGHTRGHSVMLYKNRFLFTGDHLWWSRNSQRLHASKGVCWYSWTEQTKSMAKLQNFTFEWVLPGHGQQIKLAKDVMKQELEALVKRMQVF
ncbi:MAG TPA: MBL fold metallo-hydrolase [Candidatus Limnocylindrales bacterium]|nr:MBL fold metallo-hydrolase [Candidatus Limnocylindrales bacterium]